MNAHRLSITGCLLLAIVVLSSSTSFAQSYPYNLDFLKPQFETSKTSEKFISTVEFDLKRADALTTQPGADGFQVLLASGGSLIINTPISDGERAISSVKIVAQHDGNLVIYEGWDPVWSSGSRTKIAATHCVMQHDGNLVISTAPSRQWLSATVIWASNTQGSQGAYLEINWAKKKLRIKSQDGTKILWTN